MTDVADRSEGAVGGRVVLMPADVRAEALGALPPGLRVVHLAPGAEPGPEALAARAIVLGFDLSHLVPRLAEFTELELVQTLNAGIEWLLPLVPPGVTLCNASGVHDIPVAEWVVGTILATYKQLAEHVLSQREGRWRADANALSGDPSLIRADDLHGKRVVIVGHGSIGRAAEARLVPFGATVEGVTHHGRDGSHTPDALPELVSTADVLVLLCPLTDETRGLVDAQMLSRLPDEAIVVNASRGPVVDQAALERELRSGRLRAVLDVTDPEPLPPDATLWSAPNLIITSHSAGSSRRWMDRAWTFVGEQLRRWAEGRPLENVRTDY